MFEPRVPGFIQIPSPYPYRYQAPPGVSPGIAAANELEQAILREGADTVGMFLVEPVQGAGGVIVPQRRLFPPASDRFAISTTSCWFPTR